MNSSPVKATLPQVASVQTPRLRPRFRPGSVGLPVYYVKLMVDH